jgi:FtsH-binding integral membrane protein
MQPSLLKSCLRFVVVGLFVAGIGEWWFSGGDLAHFLKDISIAALYLCVAFLADRQLSKTLYPPARAAVSSYCFFALLGLGLFSWLLLGNDPWRNPAASQVSLFCYWAAIVFLPRLYNETTALAVAARKRMMVFGFTAAAFTTVTGFALESPFREMFFGPGIFVTYGGVNLLYWRYLWQADRDQIQTPEDIPPTNPAA